MTRLSWWLTVGLMACAPPPEPDGGGTTAGEPRIELLHPPANVGTIELDAAGRLSFLVVADIDDLEFVEPNAASEDIEGQGHYHVNINGTYIDAPPASSYDYTSNPGEFAVDQAISLSVTLASNTHEDLDQFEDWSDTIEFRVAAFRPGGPPPRDTGDTFGGDTLAGDAAP